MKIVIRKILLSNISYIILCLLMLLNYLISINKPYKEVNLNKEFLIERVSIKNNKINFILKNKQKIACTYYINGNYPKIKEGMYIKVNAVKTNVYNNTILNNFNYKNYLRSKGINESCQIKEYKRVFKKIGILYLVRNKIHQKTLKMPYIKGYLNAFILGDKSFLEEEEINNYKLNGITHLFAISGMHISFFAGLIFVILNKLKIKDDYTYVIAILIVWFYIIISGCNISALRAGIIFTIFSLGKVFVYEIKPINALILAAFILSIKNVFIFYDISFLYSFLSSAGLMYGLDNDKSYLKSSYYACIFTLPITINNFYSFNILSIFLNVIFVPLVSIIYPVCIISFLFSPLKYIAYILIFILKVLNNLFAKFTFFTLIIPKLSIIFIILYYIVIFKYKSELKKVIFIVFIILFNSLIIKYDGNYYAIFFDVKQGDSILVRHRNKAILIDTGGNVNTTYYVTNNIITYLKSIGITKIKALITSHGDYDHMGEAINLVENFKVDRVIFNCGEFNELENELIKVLDKKRIPYYSCIKELNVNDNKFYFLQTKEYDNENDNSNVIYTELNGYKFMFMGDAGIEKEKDILEKYNISNINVLKVGHHGSKTSSSKEFVDEINPKYSIISVGKNNRYGHPNKEVLNNLKDSKIYRTDQDGSILFKIKNNKLKIETCSP